MANLRMAAGPADDAAVEKVAIAAAYHDIGIWTARTFDYLAPSAKLACDHLACGGHADWRGEVDGMIREHHKIRGYRGEGAALVEPFRRADWIDVSRGVLSFGLPRHLLRAIFTQWPNAGFHRRLVRLTLREARAHPLRPLPVLKW
jgi:hypothetical protein